MPPWRLGGSKTPLHSPASLCLPAMKSAFGVVAAPPPCHSPRLSLRLPALACPSGARGSRVSPAPILWSEAWPDVCVTPHPVEKQASSPRTTHLPPEGMPGAPVLDSGPLGQLGGTQGPRRAATTAYPHVSACPVIEGQRPSVLGNLGSVPGPSHFAFQTALATIERFEFYQRAKKAFAVVATG